MHSTLLLDCTAKYEARLDDTRIASICSHARITII